MAWHERRSSERNRALLLTVLLHGLALATVLHSSRPGKTDGDVAQVATRATWITPLDTSNAQPPPQPLLSDAALASPQDDAAMEALRAIAVPELDPAIVNAGASTPDQTAGNSMPAEIRYMGEVTARIQRVWNVPAAARDQHCLVRIEVGSSGEVRTLTVQACDAEPALQASIEQAIRRAAPLPPRVQGETAPGDLTLEFAAFAAAEGRRSSVQPAGAQL
jgi:hypothetical protein